MFFVQGLSDIQRFFGGKAVTSVRFPLQKRQIVQLERIFLNVLNFIRFDNAGLAAYFSSNRASLIAVR
ncbi:hypothetical protein D3C85_1510050 [compost metagenome]